MTLSSPQQLTNLTEPSLVRSTGERLTGERSGGNRPTGDHSTDYQYNYSHIPPLAMVDVLPIAEEFPRAWYRILVKEVRQLFINTLITNRGNRGDKQLRDDIWAFIFEAVREETIPAQLSLLARVLQVAPQLLIKRISRNYKELDDLFLALLKDFGLPIFRDFVARLAIRLDRGHPVGHVKQLAQYEQLYPVLPIPAVAKTHASDEAFAQLQVAGFNPLMIQRIAQLDERFPVTEAQYQAVMGGDDSLAAAGAEGRLYLSDYGVLEHAIHGTYLTYQKYAYAPLALFAVPKGADPSRQLRAIAIQAGQTPDADHPIVTPKSAHYNWLAAKAMVQVADANFHEAVSHLGRTHLFVGPFVLATHRQLPEQHPLSLLLRPHFEGTLAINDAARRILIAPGGGVDRLLSSTIDNARVLAVVGLQSYGFNAAMLPQQLKQRGVDDVNALPVYPYRDDALLIWEAIHRWVSNYLGLYYPSDTQVQQDKALQAWAIEVQAPNGGRVVDFGEQGSIQTRDYLINAVTLIIFTASAQHAAVNFPQKDIMSHAPTQPLAGYLPASILRGEVSEQDYFNLLPPLEQAQHQINLLNLLGSIYYNRLGDYPDGHFSDTQIQPLLQAFQTKLQQIEGIIEQRNQKRPAYNYLLPSRIPQSINI
jgi:arachidonate 15-lipoxygenase